MPEEELAGKAVPKGLEPEEAAANGVQPIIRVLVGTIAFLEQSGRWPR